MYINRNVTIKMLSSSNDQEWEYDERRMDNSRNDSTAANGVQTPRINLRYFVNGGSEKRSIIKYNSSLKFETYSLVSYTFLLFCYHEPVQPENSGCIWTFTILTGFCNGPVRIVTVHIQPEFSGQSRLTGQIFTCRHIGQIFRHIRICVHLYYESCTNLKDQLRVLGSKFAQLYIVLYRENSYLQQLYSESSGPIFTKLGKHDPWDKGQSCAKWGLGPFRAP